MLYVRVELWPGGDSGRRKLLGEARISLIGGTERSGTYWASLTGVRGRELDCDMVSEFPRKRLLAWDLLLLALMKLRGGRQRQRLAKLL